MTLCNFRLQPELVAVLRAQAKARNLSFSAHVRSQLKAVSLAPVDVLKVAETAR